MIKLLSLFLFPCILNHSEDREYPVCRDGYIHRRMIIQRTPAPLPYWGVYGKPSFLLAAEVSHVARQKWEVSLFSQSATGNYFLKLKVNQAFLRILI
jgi:hypothetical protein